MSKQFLSIILACVMLLVTGERAQAASLNIGLCEGELTTEGLSKTGSGTIEVAVIVPASTFAQYAGAQLSGMRIGLCLAEGISNVKGWVRTSIEGENLCTATVTNPVVGWNEVTFDAPCDYTLRADEDLVIGYQFEQQKSTKCISVAGPKNENGYWLARNGSWQNNSDKVEGSASIELLIEGEMVPSKNLIVESYSYPKLIAYGQPFTADIVVHNMAKNAIEGYKLAYQPTMAEVLEEIDRTDVTLQYRERDTIHLVIDAEQQAPDEVRFAVPCYAVAEGDEIADDNQCILYRSNYTVSYPHLLLMEEFTTEECGNCPRAINTLAQMTNEGYKFAQVSHHVGYYTDFLTVDSDKKYLWLYGEDGSFAPAGMFDRTWNAAFHTTQMRYTPVFSIGYADSFRPALEAALELPAFVQLTPVLTYDEASRNLTIDVEIEKAKTLEAISQEPRLTVYIIEDSIPMMHQAGISSSTFCHRHVMRQCLTDAWGDVLEWEEMQAKAHLEFNLPVEWNAEKVAVVAFVNNYNPEDRNDCMVFNTAVAELYPNEEQGIEQIRIDLSEGKHKFDLWGRKVASGMLQITK